MKRLIASNPSGPHYIKRTKNEWVEVNCSLLISNQIWAFKHYKSNEKAYTMHDPVVDLGEEPILLILPKHKARRL